MTDRDFDHIKQHVERRPAEGSRNVIANSSWAVWKAPAKHTYDSQDDLAFPGEVAARPVAHIRAVLLGLNPGKEITTTDWLPFHHHFTSNDHLLAEACRDTGLWGAFMTDLYFDQYIGRAENVVSDKQSSKRAVQRLLGLLPDGADPVIICLGGDAYNGLRRGLRQVNKDRKGHGEEPIEPRYIQALHYGSRNHPQHACDPRRYRDLVHGQIRAAGHGAILSP